MNKLHVALIGGILIMLMASGAMAQQGRFSVQFENTPLTRVLDALKRFDPNLAFSLAPGIGERPVTASLVEVTVDEAMTIILSQAGLMSIKDEGVYQIREKPERSGARAARPVPSFAAPVFNRPTAPTAAGAAPVAPTAAAAPGEGEEEEKPPLRLITIKYADPAAISMLFGGPEPIWGDMGGGGGGGSTGSYGGGQTGGRGGYSGGQSGGRGGYSGGQSGGRGGYSGGQTGGRGGYSGGQTGGRGGYR